jgi:hypothetical protein
MHNSFGNSIKATQGQFIEEDNLIEIVLADEQDV